MERTSGETGTEPLVVPLASVDGSDQATVGGKGATLGRLLGTGFHVPDGFCVTTAAYERLIPDELREAIRALDERVEARPGATDRDAAAIRERIRAIEPPDELRVELTDALAELEGSSFAVRSSATAEDLPWASFAGQHETYLGVSPEAVPDRILDCMASLFTDRAVAYRRRNDIPNASVALAVVVQAMVDADAAGVLFTADPTTGNRTIASVDATYGLGDPVVSGDVEADNALVEKSTGAVRSYAVGAKRNRMTLGASGTDVVTVDADEDDGRALTDEQLSDLVELGVRIEELFDRPQDIEWALVDGSFVVLQARPITTLFPLPEPAPTDGRLHAYLSLGHVQAMAEAMPPLVVDLWRVVMDDTLGTFSGDETAVWSAEAGGRVYYDITPVLRVNRFRDGVVGYADSFNRPAADGLRRLLETRPTEFDQPSAIRSAISTVLAVGRVVRTIGPILPAIGAGFLGAFVRAGDDVDRLRRWYVAWGRQSAADLLDTDDDIELARSIFGGFSANLGDLMRTVYPRVMPLFAAMTAEKWLESMFPDDRELIDAAGRGFRDEVGTRMTRHLNDLAIIAREHPHVARAIEDREGLDAIAELDGGEGFVDAFDEFLESFGHRATGEIDVSRPRWRDDPTGLLGVIRGNLLTGDADAYRNHLDELEHEAIRAIATLERKADRGPFGPVRKPLVSRLLKVYRGYIQLRDEPKHGTAFFFAAWHDGLREIGDRLAARGQLEDPEAVWYLRRSELFELLESESALPPDLEKRRREHERFARLDAPPLITSEGETPVGPDHRSLGDSVFSGTGVSSGIVEGIARVVFDPSETTLESGEILVAPSCDPGWTPLFLNAAGLITEVGGRMTHGALVAREYGLPAVMSVPNATERIETGRRVRIDGAQGIVELLE